MRTSIAPPQQTIDLTVLTQRFNQLCRRCARVRFRCHIIQINKDSYHNIILVVVICFASDEEEPQSFLTVFVAVVVVVVVIVVMMLHAPLRYCRVVSDNDKTPIGRVR